MKKKKTTTPDFFIIESIKSYEERLEERHEGKFLENYLKLLGKNVEYYYFRTSRELYYLADKFKESRYRYLYISCHGDENNIYSTLDKISYKDFSEIFQKKLNNRRIFISGCKLGTKSLAEKLFEKNGGMYSLTAPKYDVSFSKMIPFWISFFFLMEKIDNKYMKSSALYPLLQLCSNIFEVTMVHFNKKPNNTIQEKTFETNDIFSEEEMNKILGLKSAAESTTP